MNNSSRYQVAKITGLKFEHALGYTMGEGFAILDTIEGKFVGTEGFSHPWDYSKKSVAVDIVNQFNTVGPVGVVYLIKPISNQFNRG